MKTIILILALLCAFACEEEKIDPLEQLGCVSGVNKSGGDRVYLFCAKRRDFLAGSHYRPIVKYYTSLEFKPVSSCSECN